MEVSPIEMVFGMRYASRTTSAGQLELDTVELEVTGTTSALLEACATPESILGASRFSDELPGHGLQGPAQRVPIASGIASGSAPGMGAIAGSDPEQVQMSRSNEVEQRAKVSVLFDQRRRAQPAHTTVMLITRWFGLIHVCRSWEERVRKDRAIWILSLALCARHT